MTVTTYGLPLSPAQLVSLPFLNVKMNDFVFVFVIRIPLYLSVFNYVDRYCIAVNAICCFDIFRPYLSRQQKAMAYSAGEEVV